MAVNLIQFENEKGEKMFPCPYQVGDIYITTKKDNPNTLWGGMWSKIGTNRVLMTAPSDDKLGTTVESGLPNITGNVNPSWDGGATSNIMNMGGDGAMYTSRNRNEGSDHWQYVNVHETPSIRDHTISFDASRSNGIYGRSSIVQPPAFYVNIWLRTG